MIGVRALCVGWTAVLAAAWPAAQEPVPPLGEDPAPAEVPGDPPVELQDFEKSDDAMQPPEERRGPPFDRRWSVVEIQRGLRRLAERHPELVRLDSLGRSAGGRELSLVFRAAIGQPDPRDRIRLDADPPLEIVVPGAVHGDSATAALLRNSLEPLLAAPPGLHTVATLPPARFRAPRVLD